MLVGTVHLVNNSLQNRRSGWILLTTLQLLGPRRDIGKRIVDLVTQTIRQVASALRVSLSPVDDQTNALNDCCRWIVRASC